MKNKVRFALFNGLQYKLIDNYGQLTRNSAYCI